MILLFSSQKKAISAFHFPVLVRILGTRRGSWLCNLNKCFLFWPYWLAYAIPSARLMFVERKSSYAAAIRADVGGLITYRLGIIILKHWFLKFSTRAANFFNSCPFLSRAFMLTFFGTSLKDEFCFWRLFAVLTNYADASPTWLLPVISYWSNSLFCRT